MNECLKVWSSTTTCFGIHVQSSNLKIASVLDYQQVLNLMYEFPKDDTNAPKQAAVLEDHTLKCDC